MIRNASTGHAAAEPVNLVTIAANGASGRIIRPIVDAATKSVTQLLTNKEANMNRIRSYYDADHTETLDIPTNYRTDQNKHKLYCSMCGESLFVNEYIFDDVNRVIEETLENPLLCQNCIELDDEAYNHN
jgi:hypothetical protein